MLSRDMGKTLTTSVVQWTSYSIISMGLAEAMKRLTPIESAKAQNAIDA
jgi:hypothetical protein